ncbi:MAG: MAPEG family protein [bacterium]|nr:hypothetical protein [Deltaproteobacteria bacterium]MCP4908713.1 MAPEG family protein [bacterium]
MTTPFWCLVAVIFIPIALAAVGGQFRSKAFGSADNKNPRAQATQLSDAGARAYAAQENAWEAAIMFSVAVITTHLAGLAPSEAAPFTIAFVVLRVVHGISYIRDIDKVRSLSFLLGLVCMIALFVKAA